MMTTRWIVAVDFSDLSRLALQRALDDCTRNERTELHVVLALEDHPREAKAWEPHLARGHRRLQSFVDRTRKAHRPDALVACFLHVLLGDPADVILSVADEVGASQIFLGTHGRRGIARAIVGSVAETVVRRALCPVLVVRPASKRREPIVLEPATPGREEQPMGQPHVYRYESLLDTVAPPGKLL